MHRGADGRLRLSPHPAGPFVQDTPDNSYSGVARTFRPCQAGFLRNDCLAALIGLDLLVTGTSGWPEALGMHQIPASGRARAVRDMLLIDFVRDS